MNTTTTTITMSPTTSATATSSTTKNNSNSIKNKRPQFLPNSQAAPKKQRTIVHQTHSSSKGVSVSQSPHNPNGTLRTFTLNSHTFFFSCTYILYCTILYCILYTIHSMLSFISQGKHVPLLPPQQQQLQQQQQQ
jgi:hypothetical protein